MIAHQIPDNATAIGIIRHQLTRVVIQGVGSAGLLGPVGPAVRELPGLFLERHRDIEALAAPLEKLSHRTGEVFKRCLDRGVLHRLTGLLCKQAVDSGGFAVTDRVADHRVQIIGHWFLPASPDL